MKKKLIAVAVILAVVFTPFVAFAQTTSQTEQINAEIKMFQDIVSYLQQQINDLEAQVNILVPNSGVVVLPQTVSETSNSAPDSSLEVGSVQSPPTLAFTQSPVAIDASTSSYNKWGYLVWDHETTITWQTDIPAVAIFSDDLGNTASFDFASTTFSYTYQGDVQGIAAFYHITVSSNGQNVTQSAQLPRYQQ